MALTAQAPTLRRTITRGYFHRLSAHREALIVGLLLLGAVGFNLFYLWPEVAIPAPKTNDAVLHLLALKGTVSAFEAGQDPTDFWFAPIAEGYPFFHYYQHLPHLVVAGVYLLLRGAVPLLVLYNGTLWLLLSVFPLSVFYSMRRLGFPGLPAAFAALVASLPATDGTLHGLDFSSYVWRGYGLYTQLWGMVLLPLALAQGYAVLRQGQGYALAVALLAATTVSHLVFGYLAVGSLVVFCLAVSLRQAWVRLRRLALMLGLLVLVTCYFVIPILLDSTYVNRTVWEPTQRFDSYGAQWVLEMLFRGELFD